jgi:pimeloyl-ACP methyl ester carboxylesterase
VNGTRLYFETAGRGPAVVLIHGGLVDSRMWDGQFGELARRYRVIRYDLRGYGKSDPWKGQFSHVEDLYELLKFLRVEKVALVGLSLGGVIALDFSLSHPDMVTALVPVSSGVNGYKYTVSEQTIAPYRAAVNEGPEKAVSLWLEHPFFAFAKKDRGAERRIREMLLGNVKAWPSTYSGVVRWPEPPSVERLAAIKAPTLIVVGDQDNANATGVAELLRERIAGARKVVIKGAGHHLNMEKRAEFNRIVLNFLAGPYSLIP